MNARARYVATAAVVAATASAAAAQGVSRIDAQDYTFHVVLPDTGGPVRVTSVMRYRIVGSPDSVTLHLVRAMRVLRVTRNGNDVGYARSDSALRVPLESRPAPCSATPPASADRSDPCAGTISVDVEGTPTDGLIITRDPSGRTQYFADHWPNRARHWLPVVDHPSDKATVEWRVHAPSEMRVVANGRALEESPLPNEPRRTLTVWRTDRPIPTYLMVIGAARMARIDLGLSACGREERGGCVSQDVYEAPELAPRTPPGFAAAGRIMDWMSRWVAPFPYERLSHVQSSTRFGGMENAGAIFYSDRAFRDMTLGEQLVAHETAHQWFGNSATPVRWPDLWLSEGFATYFAALWAREAHGDTAFRTALAGIRARVLDAPVVAQRPVVDSVETDLMQLLNANSYQKGGFVLHMLRMQLGDSAWIRGVRAYYAAHRHGNAQTSELRAAFERESRTPLAWFFAQWLERPGFAELTARWEHAATGIVSVHIEQGTRFGAYRLRLPIAIERADGTMTRVTVDVPAQAQVVMRVPGTYAARPRRVVVDPDGDVLGRVVMR